MKGKYSLFSGKQRKYASGDKSFMGNGKRSEFAKYIAHRPDIDPNGTLDIIAHGNSKYIEVVSSGKVYNMSPREAAKLIRKNPGFKNAKSIRLLSCSTGASSEGFAQHLANALGKPVLAPNNTIYAYPNGKYWIKDINYKTKGDFIEYKPGGIKHGRK